MRLVTASLCGLMGLVLCTAGWAAESPSRLDGIHQRGVLKVCYWPDYYGISYRNPKTHQLTGIDVEMARALAQDLGVTVKFVESSFASLVPDVTEGRCDVAMFGVGVTPERLKHLVFTEPHLASDVYAITSRSNRRMQTWQDIDQPGSVVAVIKGTVHEPIMRERLQHATLQVLDTPRAREQDVQSGRADVFMTDYPYSRRMLETSDWARLIEPQGVYHVTPYAYALAPGDPRWHARLQRFVEQIKRDGRLLDAAERQKLERIVLIDTSRKSR